MGILGTGSSWKEGVKVPETKPTPPAPNPEPTTPPPQTSPTPPAQDSYYDEDTSNGFKDAYPAPEDPPKPEPAPPEPTSEPQPTPQVEQKDDTAYEKSQDKPVDNKTGAKPTKNETDYKDVPKQKKDDSAVKPKTEPSTKQDLDMNKASGGSSSLSFPKVDRIMGLPPMWVATDSDGQMDSLVECSFPVLLIRPLELKSEASSNDRDVKTNPLSDSFFKFAVQADSSIGFNHSNDYQEAQIVQSLKSLIPSDTMREVKQLGKVMSGTLGSSVTGAANSMFNFGHELKDALNQGMKNTAGTNDLMARMANIGTDVMSGLLEGARIDLPNIWTDSKTGMSWTFNIKLRTMAVNVNDPSYKKEILEPLKILMMLCLPVSGKSFAYLEPPYVEIKLGSILHCRLGGVTSFSPTYPLNELNFNQMPRAIDVSITITDLYNVMVQTEDGGDHENEDVPTLTRLLKQMQEKSVIPIPSTPKKILLEEYGAKGKGGSTDSSVTGKEGAQAAASKTKVGSGLATSVAMKGVDVAGLTSTMPTSVTSAAGVSLDENTLSLTSGALNGAVVGSIPNITDLTGNLGGLLSGGLQNIDLGASGLSLDGLTSLGSSFSGNLASALSSTMSSIFTAANISSITGGLTTSNPANFLSAIMRATQGLGSSLLSNITSGDNITNIAKIVSNVVGSASTLVGSAASLSGSGKTDISISPDTLLSTVMSAIKSKDSNLDIGIRLSQTQQSLLSSYTTQLADTLSKPDVCNDMDNMKSDILTKNPVANVATAIKSAVSSIGGVAGAVNSLAVVNAALEGVGRGTTYCKVSANLVESTKN